MKKRRIISMILVLVILLLNIPEVAFSSEMESAKSDNNPEESTNNATDDKIFILEEDTSKRGQFEKHYLCSDGSYIAVTYAESVHYLNSDYNQRWYIDDPDGDEICSSLLKSVIETGT